MAKQVLGEIDADEDNGHDFPSKQVDGNDALPSWHVVREPDGSQNA